MGSTLAEVEACVEYWGSKLVDSTYNKFKFYQWILKEFPKHSVRLPGFKVSRFPVVNGDYFEFIKATDSRKPKSILLEEPSNHPVWGVSFEEAQNYADWLSTKLGCKCRLPTEAEWEYVARGSSGREYPFGTEFDSNKCNTIEAGIGHTTPVDLYTHAASEFGVCDLAGNVEEWTIDFYQPYTGGTYIDDDLSMVLGKYRILRGGSFSRGGDLARCARRHGPFPSEVFQYTGFRLVIPESMA